VKSGTAGGHPIYTPPPVAAQYENLRMAALGEPLAPEARIGLGIFLRCGMWGWVRALAVLREPAASMRPPSWTSTKPYQHQTIIQIFAAMALNTNNGRVQ
jgi:hypothetical protein